MIFALWKRDSKVFSSFIHLVSEYKVLNFWEISIQPSSFPWILTSCLYDPPFPQLTVIDALRRAQVYQSHGQQEQQHLGRSHAVSVSWYCSKLRHTPVENTRQCDITFPIHGLTLLTNIWFATWVFADLLGSRSGQALHQKSLS